MTKVYLITGFLGSGKTTFLQNILTNDTKKSGVLMNEFGSISIDGSLINRENMNMIELTNGSIFCSCLKDNFIESLRTLLLENLDNIYIESSGLADPANMLSIIDLLRKQCSCGFSYEGSICLVDGLNFIKELDIMVSVENQIRHSKIILINKIDLISSETISEIKNKIRKINNSALVFEIKYGEINFDLFDFSCTIDNKSEETSNTSENRPKTIILKLTDATDVRLEDIMTILNALKGFCYRIKGFITLENVTYKIDTVNEKIDVIQYGSDDFKDQTLVLISKIGTGIISKIHGCIKDTLDNKINIIS